MSFPDDNVSSPIKSPSLAEYDSAMFTDEDGNVMPMVAAICPDADGNANLGDAVLEAGEVSQVTGRRLAPMVVCPGDEKIPLMALMSLDSDGNPIPFKPAAATAADTAASAAVVSGKFQSTVQTGTGSSQNIAHGLGATPSLVLLSIYDTNGVALPIAMAEGAHDGTNVKATVTSGVKFKVIAFK